MVVSLVGNGFLVSCSHSFVGCPVFFGCLLDTSKKKEGLNKKRYTRNDSLECQYIYSKSLSTGIDYPRLQSPYGLFFQPVESVPHSSPRYPWVGMLLISFNNFNLSFLNVHLFCTDAHSQLHLYYYCFYTFLWFRYCLKLLQQAYTLLLKWLIMLIILKWCGFKTNFRIQT